MSIEIEAALARGIPVVPVLVGKAAMPSESDLPPSIAPLVYRRGVPVRPDPDFHRDMDRLNTALRTILGSERELQKPKEEPVSETPSRSTASPPIKSAVENPQAVREALDCLEAIRINVELPNLVPVARKLRETSKGGEVLPLCGILTDAKATLIDQYKAVKLLSVVMRFPEAKAFLGVAPDALLDGGVVRNDLQNSALEAFTAVPASPREKWERLFDALTLVSDTLLPGIVNTIAQVTPPTERRRTSQQLTECLEMSANYGTITAICFAIKQLGDRTIVPQLIQTLEVSLPIKASPISDILVGWRVIDAAAAIRGVIEIGRFGTDYHVATLMKHLYLLEGSMCYGFLAETLHDAVPSLQMQILYQLPAITEPMFIDVVSDLAANSLDRDVRNRAAEFLKKQ